MDKAQLLKFIRTRHATRNTQHATRMDQAGPFKTIRTLATFFLLAQACACAPAPQDTGRAVTFQPFSSDSPWKHAIGSGAIYQTIANLEGIYLSINWDNRWTSALYFASPTDRMGSLYFSEETWRLLDQGLPNFGNSAEMEQTLRSKASPEPLHPANPYSTVVPGSSQPIWPLDYHQATAPYYSRTFQIPAGARPSPDSDGLISIHQPNGWVLDAYAAIVLANGDIVCMMASYVDSAGSGTGWSNGRRASMLPSFAGVVRPGELSSGAIHHALACLASPTLLREEMRWPAFAFDMRAGYSGTLPMGALLAIPPEINIDRLKLTDKGRVLAHALQNYGMYIVDRGGKGGLTLLADLNAPDIRWTGSEQDLQTIRRSLRWVSNNSEANPGGGGTPRR